MSDVSRCPDCDAELPSDAPLGLCPKCLLQEGLPGYAATMPPGEGTDQTGQTSPLDDWHKAPTTEALAPLFPQLEIIELVGQGGMGAVYRARQTKLDRDVALKILPPRFGNDPNFAERFMREAQALAKLNHANIVTVHDFGNSDGLYYLVMEFVDGVNLRDSLIDGRLTPTEALAIVPQLCDALQFAHEEGIVHRDIKPENVLIDQRGRVKIADFGLAKLLNAKVDRQLTISHQVMGTLNYMAPEQVETPLSVDHRADIYSLGVVFYELLTGELPIGRFALPSERADVSTALDDVVMRTLEKEPSRRFQQASDVKTAVQRVATSSSPPATENVNTAPIASVHDDQPRKPNLGPIVMGSTMLLLGVAFFFVFSDMGESMVFIWIAIGLAIGGAACMAGAWHRKNLVHEWKPEPGTIITGTIMCVVGVSLLVMASQYPHPANVFIWVGMGVTLGGGACLSGAFAAEKTKLAKQSPPPKPLSFEEARSQLIGPAIGLMCTGGLSLAASFLTILGVLALTVTQTKSTVTAFACLAQAEPLAAAAPTVLASQPNIGLFVGLGLILLINVPVSIFLLIGGWKMLQVRTYGLALAASIIALVPIHIAWVLGIPLGIWSLAVLGQPAIKEAFRTRR